MKSNTRLSSLNCRLHFCVLSTAMVLKKSNSSLNSGATQRVSGGCFINPCIRGVRQRTAGLVQVDLELTSIEPTEEVVACLDQINGYLRFSGPTFSHVSNRRVERMLRSHWNRQSLASLNKGGNWVLTQRMNALLKDIDFLRGVSSTMDINFIRISENLAAASRSKGVTNTKNSFEIIKAFEREERERESTMPEQASPKRNMKQTNHDRGVQRLCNAKQNSRLMRDVEGEEDEDALEPKPSLTFTLYEPCVVDVRASKLCQLGRTRKRNGQKSFGKCGHRATYRKWFCEIKEAVQDMAISPQGSHRDGNVGIAEAYNDGGDVSATMRSFNLKDIMQRKKILKRKHGYLKSTKELTPQNDVLTCDKHFHAKGSYILVGHSFYGSGVTISRYSNTWKAIDVSGNRVSQTANDISGDISRLVSVTAVEDKVHKGSIEETLPIASNEMKPATQDLLQSRAVDFDPFTKSFIRVQVVMPGSDASLASEILDMVQLNSKSNITIGDSLPLCFCISPRRSSCSNSPYAVALQAKRDGITWLLSVQGSSKPQRNSFRNKLSRLNQSEEQISLIEFIKVIEETLGEEAVSQDLMTAHKCATSPEAERFQHHIWGDLASRTGHGVSMHTAEEAVEKIKAGPEPHCQLKERKTTKKLDKNSVYIFGDIVCGVCFSPCNLYGDYGIDSAMMLTSCRHAHCVSCWRSHVHHNVHSGALRIRCMTSGCDTLLDETTLKTLVPASIVTSWQTRVRDQLLETSVYTSWCPGGLCGLVAVSSGTLLKKQFGSPLICPCSQCWCSSCQEEPHWPVSCDQMAVYKKLLSRTGGDSKALAKNASCCIDVKKCPQCKYPIEKSTGCPSMVCQMCHYNFCWNCLHGIRYHNMSSCTASTNSNFLTYHVYNKLVYDVPIQYFTECVQVNRQCVELCKKYSRFKKQQELLQTSSLYRRPPLRLRSISSVGDDANLSMGLVEEAFSFLRGAFTQIELFYLLLGFVQLSKLKSKPCLYGFVHNRISRLQFIMDRLDKYVVDKPLNRISNLREHARLLLDQGVATLDELFAIAPKLQQMSKDVETAWVGKIDPSKYLRYM